jgi:2-polyprenyl-3-methyl-5-hydroxy-6-metoxy-1,4-benzoquinol methylase
MKIEITHSVGLKALEKMRLAKVLPLVEGKLLDIGCGYNNLVGNYAGEGVGVDVFTWPGSDKGTIVVKNAAQLDFPSGSYDTITLIACLNHIPNREEVLKEAHRLLKPEGKILVTMIPLRIGELWHLITEPLWGESRKGRGFVEGETGGINPSEVRRLLQAAGFTCERLERFMCGINVLFVARKQAAGR